MTETSNTRNLFKLDILKLAKDILAEVESTRAYTPNFDDEGNSKIGRESGRERV